MGFSIRGYLLEKPRVGAANAAYTLSPDNLISNPGAFGAVYGSDETTPGRAEYLVLALQDGDLAEAEFGWTKNESGVQRFGYDGSEGRFRPLGGSSRTLLGTMTSDANTARLKVTKPTVAIGLAPYRLSLGPGSGTTVPIQTVANDGAFTTPTAGTAQLSLDTGNLHWNPADLVGFSGLRAYFQRQQFFTSKESSGAMGVLGSDPLLLNPIPLPGQHPLVRLGFGLHLTGSSVATESGFASNPAAGTFQWAQDTGRIKLNSGDLAANTGEKAYYDGVLLSIGLTLPRQSIGTVVSPMTITGLPSEGADLIFRALPPSPSDKVVQFPEVSRTETFSLFGKTGEVQVNPITGGVQFSLADRAAYGSRSVQVVFGDLPIERGVSLRLFRTPVDLEGTSPELKDVSTFFPSPSSTLADPIVGTPFVFLPVLPIDDPAYPIVVRVEQGTGSFTGVLPRLDVATPPAGLGYTIDFEAKQLGFATRKNNYTQAIPTLTGALALPDPLVNPSNAVLELDQGMGFTTLVVGRDVLFDATAGMVTFVSTAGITVSEGVAGSVSAPGVLTSASTFLTDGVAAGDQLVVLSGALQDDVYTVLTVPSETSLTFAPSAAPTGPFSFAIRRAKEILADRFFKEVLLVDPNTRVEKIRGLGAITNSPRLNVNPGQAGAFRFRQGLSFLPTTTVVANNAAFTSPGSLASGTVEISADSGDLNFSQADVDAGGSLYGARRLVQGIDYLLGAELGFVQVTERLLALDELLLSYSSLQDNPPVPLEERATFLVRKELMVHPSETSTIPFNPLGRQVAAIPPPQVFRGGRPQDPAQVSINLTTSVVTFLEDVLPTPGGAMKVTDALPHGPIVRPEERVYIDYYVYDAVGGENATTVLKPPINLIKVQIKEGESSFKAPGDHTASFPSNSLLRIENEQVYYLNGATYDATANETTVTLLAPQVFRDSFSAPKLFVVSGPTRLNSLLSMPSYFVVASEGYDPVPRGMNRFRLVGDRAATYVSGVALQFTASGVNDFYLVTGSTYDAATNRTEVVLTQPTIRQYTTHTLRRSVRAILEGSATRVQTSTPPALPPQYASLEESVTVFRQVVGQPGRVLRSPDDFKIDASGVITFTDPLLPNEEFSIFYTKHRFVQGTLRASYTAAIAPNEANGLANQVLTASFTTYSPDNFFYRIETYTNFRAELAKKYRAEASSSSPSAGPRLDNMSQPRLYEQGQESVFFNEGRLWNEDFIARSTLKFYNDIINLLEDVLRNMDGRVVGDRDGRLLFDGTPGQPVANFEAATNQIDDSFQVSAFPLDFTPPLFPFKFLGTRVKAYQPNPKSRFYPTARTRFNYAVVGADTNAETGEQMVDLQATKLTGTDPTAYRRLPRARFVEDVVPGQSNVRVDTTAAVTTEPGPFRPAFTTGMRVVVRNAAGAYLIPELTPSTITVTGADTMTLTPAPFVPIPRGSTVHLAGTDEEYQKNYRLNFDVGVDLDQGHLLFVKPFPPFDGSFPAIPEELWVQTPNQGELLQTAFTMNNSLTAPEKIPMLFGKPFDDDGDQRLPLINPSYAREVAPSTEPGLKPSYLQEEQDASGDFGSLAIPPFMGTGSGSLNGAGTVLTNSTSFPSPVPQRGDLVRILSGVNANSAFRRISAVTANTITVDVPFTTDTGFDFLVTAANNLATGTLATMVGSVVTDLAGPFVLSGVRPGYTIVLMAPGHGAELERRQIASVDSATQLTLTAPFSSLVVPALYRIHNPLNTYSELSLASTTSGMLDILVDNVDSELNSIDAFFNAVFTDRMSPTVVAGNATAADTLVGLSVNFEAAGVTPGDIVFIQSGPNAGVHPIGAVVNATTLTLSDSPGLVFPISSPFRVIKLFGVGPRTIKDLYTLRLSIDAFVQGTTTWNALVTTPVPVLVPPGTPNATYFARGFTPADFTARTATTGGRAAYLATTGIPMLEAVLASGDRLYDRRYTWLDARINLEKGIIPRLERAYAQRIKTQNDIVNQLIKLLAVEGA